MTDHPAYLIWGPSQLALEITSSLSTPNGVQGVSLSSSTRYIYWRNVIPKSGTVTKVFIFVSAIAGSPPPYNVGLVGLDSVTALATTTPMGGSSVTETTLSSTGGKWITLSTPATVVAGTPFAVNVWAVGATPPDASNYATVAFSSIIPALSSGLGQTVYYTSAALTSSGSTMAIQYDDGSIHGLAFSLPCGYSSISSSGINERGSAFTVPFNCKCSGIYALHYGGVMGATALVDFVLYDPDGNVLASYSVLDADEIDYTTAAIIRWPPVSLTAGVQYRASMKVNNAVSVYPARFYMDSVEARKAVPFCLNSFYCYRSGGGAWTDEQNAFSSISPIITEITIPDGGTVVGGEYAYIG